MIDMGPILEILVILLLLPVWIRSAAAEENGPDQPESTDLSALFSGPAAAWEALRRTDGETKTPEDRLLTAVAEEWKRVYLNPGYRVYVNGTDDPDMIPVSGKHAFVVLGLMLEDGEMTDELKARCDAAAAAAQAYPDSLIVCSGGATGENNPEGHTEAGLMRTYLEQCGIDPGRILTDEQATDTIENAVNTFEILKAQRIDTITVVTSSYHQRRAHMLYRAMAEYVRETEGYSVAIAGDYGCAAERPEGVEELEARLAVCQLNTIIRRMGNRNE